MTNQSYRKLCWFTLIFIVAITLTQAKKKCCLMLGGIVNRKLW
jgi:hypothetical protein